MHIFDSFNEMRVFYSDALLDLDEKNTLQDEMTEFESQLLGYEEKCNVKFPNKKFLKGFTSTEGTILTDGDETMIVPILEDTDTETSSLLSTDSSAKSDR